MIPSGLAAMTGASHSYPARYDAIKIMQHHKKRPVIECGSDTASQGRPSKRRYPPLEPPSGPRSIIQSARRMMSGLCSMIITVFPELTSLSMIEKKFSMSFMCSPVVGSSMTYNPPVFFNTVAIFKRWLSPPDKELSDCPRVRYPRPTSCRRVICFNIHGTSPNKSKA